MTGQWYRGNSTLRSFVDDLLESACERPVFDADRIRKLQREHLDGKDNMLVIGSITTLEIWFQRHIDGTSTDPVVAQTVKRDAAH
jgi:asparagine synthase (glutamine-hydrolysing)